MKTKSTRREYEKEYWILAKNEAQTLSVSEKEDLIGQRIRELKAFCEEDHNIQGKDYRWHYGDVLGRSPIIEKNNAENNADLCEQIIYLHFDYIYRTEMITNEEKDRGLENKVRYRFTPAVIDYKSVSARVCISHNYWDVCESNESYYCGLIEESEILAKKIYFAFLSVGDQKLIKILKNFEFSR
ncbi:hypothetical protein J4468_04780 [Candidatus Woesearchaeota archaeon]|nr:hypothetical protein [Candidatus Woesearchaeota archaeon]